MPTVRNELATIRPHVSTKTAWRETIRILRRIKTPGQQPTLTSQSAVHRLLDLEHHNEMNLSSIKELLRQVVQEDTPHGKENAAIQLDTWAATWLPKHTKGPVTLTANGWPDWLSTTDKKAIYGQSSDQFTCTPTEAAELFHHLHGLNIGGATIHLSHNLPPHEVLPSVARKDRSRKRARGHSNWLPHLDDQGRISATPKSIARMHGELLKNTAGVVVDAFCGLGADTIGAALAGCRVFAVEQDPKRIELAKSNAHHFGISSKVSFVLGDATDIVPKLLHEHFDAAVFLDPPWGGVQWDRTTMNFETLFSPFTGLWNSIVGRHPLLLKLPRTFDTTSLPTKNTTWKFKIGRLEAETSPADRARTIAALTLPFPP